MATKCNTIIVQGLTVEVVRKNIKNLHLGVYPPNGHIRVATPLRIDDDAVRLAIITHLSWIRRKQKQLNQQFRQTQREMVTGESHYYQGRRYLLDVIEQDCPPSVRLVGNKTIELRVRPGMERDRREVVLMRWYRNELRKLIPELVSKWEARIGVEVEEVRIKKMKTRWGTCNIKARRIWLNLELIKHSSACIEYILVHEMIHFIERLHNDKFVAIMDQLLPQWRIRRDELNSIPLTYNKWKHT